MKQNKQIIALYTLVRHEILRMFRIFTQVFLPPVITTFLYFTIFGAIIGDRIGLVNGASYALFITPGLLMGTVITNAYSNVSTSLFSMRFQKSIDELLVSPLKDSLFLLGFVLGGILRGIIVALLVFLVALCFVDLPFSHLPLTLLMVVLVSTVFALAGFTNALVARNFDDVALIPTFILNPLTYLGGVFYSSSMLPSFWQKIIHLNPIFYMINALRYVMIGQQEVSIVIAVLMISILLIGLVILNLGMMKKGIGIRS